MIIMPERLQELMDELKLSSPETYYHAIHVKSYVYKFIKATNADGLTNYSKEEIDAICKGAILHDVGKLYVKNYVLTKLSSLTPQEKEMITAHTKLGYEAVESSLTGVECEIVKNICLYHHERFDGTGYGGMRDIPMYVNIVALCDVYDALTTNRVYRDALDSDNAIKIIKEGQCGAFPHELFKYFDYIID